MTKTTPTGVAIINCKQCDLEHPETRKHCADCNRPSLFLNGQGTCLVCENPETKAHYEKSARHCQTCGAKNLNAGKECNQCIYEWIAETPFTGEI